MVNDRKICFISCVNDEDYEQEELSYIKNLSVPDGYEMEMISVKDAASMTAGYNEGMKASDAKYKVYLHQDVFIVNKYFMQDLLDIFKEPKIGMFGLVGICKLPESGIMWDGKRIGKLYCNLIYESRDSTLGEVEGDWQCVEAIDGLLMATQYDLQWREDLFHGWDFYDVSQSQEFLRAGYQVVVPNQSKPWVMHDSDIYNLKNYYKARKIFQQEYRNYRY